HALLAHKPFQLSGEILHLLQRRKLGHLGDEVLIVDRLERILKPKLRREQLEEIVLPQDLADTLCDRALAGCALPSRRWLPGRTVSRRAGRRRTAGYVHPLHPFPTL